MKEYFLCNLLNYVVGIAKSVIYVTRTNKVEQKGEQDLIPVLKNI